ncbi:MAG: cyanophycin synthetase [Candidatus Spechtbacterales bacterium]|nr:cyanophycin synthetase [Candidatus Spechtbacterales bacterium]
MIGIKGAGMTALAGILNGRGIEVVGSDTDEVFFTDTVLKDQDIYFNEEFSPNNIAEDVDLIIYSNAYKDSSNVEMLEAKNRGLKMMSYPEALAELFNSSDYGIAVCGTHGKSTTTAMLGFILECAGLDPTVVLGSQVIAWGGNGRVGQDKYFVIEADEYKEAYLKYNPRMILVTNIDFDHPDYFKNKDEYIKSFQKFFSSEKMETIIQMEEIEQLKKFNLKLPGTYNQENANLAYTAATKIGVSPQQAKKALEKFPGLARRFEAYGEYNGALLFDDYAHHPTEIEAVLKGARSKYIDKKIIALFQPHTYSRTKEFFDEFSNTLSGADEVYILKTYGSAREHEDSDVSGKKLAESLGAKYFNNTTEAEKFFKDNLANDKVLLAIGAGDGWRVLENIKNKTS